MPRAIFLKKETSMFEGKVAIILGASAEGGSGWEIATALADKGARVAVAARREAGISELARRTGGIAIKCDAAADADVKALVDRTISEFGRLDIAVLAAGSPVIGGICEIGDDDLERATAINYYSLVYFLRHVAPVMADGGAVLALTSLSATQVSPGYAAYAAAKAASQCAIRYAAIELAPRGIRVNAISPGLIESPMARAVIDIEALRHAMYKEIPLGRGVLPTEIAATALSLVAEHSAITGQSVVVDNGMSLRRPPFPEEIPAEAYQHGATSAGY
ncbi:SDR family oxidoreductase [Novosphingobium sp.]|uniref:SDR family oxidoreductase n=1 Tax=Novosphingobium sp. TaxID=1874826 RepID=UPI0038BDF0EC